MKKAINIFWGVMAFLSFIALAGEKEPDCTNSTFLTMKLIALLVLVVSLYFLKAYKFQNNQ